MKLYQKFLYTALLVFSVLFYADFKEMETQSYEYTIVELNSDISILNNSLIVQKKENKKLLERIEEVSLEDEVETENMIYDYITANYRRTPPTVAREIAVRIIEISKEKNVAAPLILGITEVESNFNPFAVSKAGARGLMQVMPEWIDKLPTILIDKHDLHDITTGLKAGTDVFNIHLKEQKGDVNKALYYYVNKDHSYVLKVYTAMGKFLSFRSK